MTDPLAAARAEADALRRRLAELDARMTAPRQITPDELERMTTAEVNAAFETGRLDTVLGRTGTRHATGPLTADELEMGDRLDYRRLTVPGNLEQFEAHQAAQLRARSERQARDAETAALLAELDAAGTPDARYRAAIIRQSEKESPR